MTTLSRSAEGSRLYETDDRKIRKTLIYYD